MSSLSGRRAVVGASWFLVAVLIALLPIGGITLMYWSRFGVSPRLVYLTGAGELLVVTVGVSAQAVVDGGRLAAEPRIPGGLRALVGTFAALAGLALVATAFWYGALLWPTATDTGAFRYLSFGELTRVAQGSLVVFTIAVVAGAIFAAIREASRDA